MRFGQGEFIHQGDEVFKRLAQAQIVSVDTGTNTCTIQYLDTLGVVSGVQINYPYISAGGSQWAGIRFMPDKGDIVIVGFRADNFPEIVAYKLANYKQLTQVNADKKGFFRALNPGEISIATKGGAEIYLSKDGYVLIAGKTNSLVFDIEKSRIHALTGTWQVDSGDVEFRFGNVWRTIAGVKRVIENGVTFLKELAFDFGTLISGAFGNVTDDNGVPKQSQLSASLVAQLIGAGFEVQIDVEGNVIIKATVNVFNSSDIRLGGTGASDPAVLGNEIKTALTDIKTALSDLVTSVTIINTAFGAMNGDTALKAVAPATVTAAGVESTAQTAQVVILNADVLKVIADIQTILSKVVKLE